MPFSKDVLWLTGWLSGVAAPATREPCHLSTHSSKTWAHAYRRGQVLHREALLERREVRDRQRLLSRLLAGGALHGHIARISLSGERRGAAAGSLAEAYQSKSVWEEQDVTAKEVWDVARESGRIVPQSELVTS